MRTLIMLIACLFFLMAVAGNAQQTISFEHIKTDNGLSNNTINCITQDSLGNMWFGTYDGLNRYDGQTIIVYKYDAKNTQLSLANNKIERLVTDGNGNIWIGMPNNMIAKLTPNRPNGFVHYDVSKYSKSEFGNLRVGRDGHIIVDFDSTSIYYKASSDAFETCTDHPVDDEKLLFFKTLFPNKGIEKICERRKGEYWLSTRTNGILVAKKNAVGKFTTSVVNQQAANSQSLSNNEVYDIYLDKYGVLWVGTKDGGVNRLIESATPLHSIAYSATQKNTLPQGTIRAICEDASGNLWIGTYNNGVAIYSKKNGIIGQINQVNTSVTDVNWDRIRSIYQTSDHSMWIGSYKGLCRVSPNGSRTYLSTDNRQLPHGRVYAMVEDKKSQLWICGWEGLALYNLKNNTVKHIEIPELEGLHCRTICMGADDNVWIGTEYDGVFIYNPNNNVVTQLKKKTDSDQSLSNNSIFAILRTHGSVYWIATADGLTQYDDIDKTFHHYTTSNGLMSNLVFGVMPDKDGNIWASTSAGISCINQQTQFTTNFNRQDGLLNEELTEGAYFRGMDGTIYIGGTKGVDYLHPDSLITDLHVPDVYVSITNIESSIEKVIDNNNLILGYYERDNNLIIHAQHTGSTRKNVIAWRISGINNEWQYQRNSKASISLANLPAGNFQLEYKAANNTGAWSQVKTLTIRIEPPIWQNRWALAVLIILVSGAIFLFYHLRLNGVRKYNKELTRLVDERTAKIRQQTALLEDQNHKLHTSNNDILKQKDQIIAQRDHLAELHQKLKDETASKLNMQANISHELRTPLTLIKGPVERLLQTDLDKCEQHKLLKTVKEQTEYLLKLVDQTLDYKKLESGQMTLQCQTGNIVSFCNDIIELFKDEALELNISLTQQIDTSSNWLILDYEKLKTIISNLLSNALKFTPQNGNIKMKVLQQQEQLLIEVIDSGIGIPEDCIEFVFDRYYQIGRAINPIMKGSGIGLALAKEIATLHGGEIGVTSTAGFGCTFWVKLPVQALSANEHEEENAGKQVVNGKITKQQPNSVPVVLLVEDHFKMREYIQEILQRHNFSVLMAENGVDAVRTLKHHKVDLILSDWMMPEMDGIEFCKNAKSSPKTRHIPFVLFTAKNSSNDHETALECGANDFVTKPFSEKVLIQKINTLIARDKSLLEAYKTQQQITAVDKNEPTEDDKLLNRMVQVVNENIANPAFNPDELCELVGLSKMKLYRKCKQLTGFAPIELIRSIRIKRAAQLLNNRGFTISEVGFKVGFNDPKYFSRCFQKEFQMTPTQFQEQNLHQYETPLS